MTVTFLEETELCERSLRRLAESKGCALSRSDNEYTIILNGEDLITVDDNDCWSILNSM